MTPLQIVDVSSNNHPNNEPFDFGAIARSGMVQAAIVKATEGGQVIGGQLTGYANPWAVRDCLGFQLVGIPVVCYHFARFGDVTQELRWFLINAGATLARALDFETSTDVDWINEFCAGLVNPPLGYGSVGTFPDIAAWIMRWVAAPSWKAAPPDTDLWQFTSSASVPGIPGPVDLSQWVGDQSDFESIFGKPATAVREGSSDVSIAQAPRLDGSGIDILSVGPGAVLSWQGNTPYFNAGAVEPVDPQPPGQAVSVNVVWLTDDDGPAMVVTVELLDGSVWVNAMHPQKAWGFGAWSELAAGPAPAAAA